MTGFESDRDRDHEREVAATLQAAWGCVLHSFGGFSAVDWYAVKDGRLVGVLELKCRTHASTAYPTVYLSLRKWLSLTLAAVATGTPAYFVARFTDGIYWVRVSEVDARRVRITGHAHPRARMDVEPLIDVPVRAMTAVPTVTV